MGDLRLFGLLLGGVTCYFCTGMLLGAPGIFPHDPDLYQSTPDDTRNIVVSCHLDTMWRLPRFSIALFCYFFKKLSNCPYCFFFFLKGECKLHSLRSLCFQNNRTTLIIQYHCLQIFLVEHLKPSEFEEPNQDRDSRSRGYFTSITESYRPGFKSQLCH